MFDTQEPKTFPEQVKLLCLVLLFELILCALADGFSLRFVAAADPRSFTAVIVGYAAAALTIGFLLMNVPAVVASIAAIRDPEFNEFRPLAKVSAVATSVSSAILIALLLADNADLDLAAACCGLVVMFAVMAFPVRRMTDNRNGKT